MRLLCILLFLIPVVSFSQYTEKVGSSVVLKNNEVIRGSTISIIEKYDKQNRLRYKWVLRFDSSGMVKDTTETYIDSLGGSTVQYSSLDYKSRVEYNDSGIMIFLMVINKNDTTRNNYRPIYILSKSVFSKKVKDIAKDKNNIYVFVRKRRKVIASYLSYVVIKNNKSGLMLRRKTRYLYRGHYSTKRKVKVHCKYYKSGDIRSCVAIENGRKQYDAKVKFKDSTLISMKEKFKKQGITVVTSFK